MIFHIRLENVSLYQAWLRAAYSQPGAKGLYRVKVDPAPREGMVIDEVLIFEYPLPEAAMSFMSALGPDLQSACRELNVLAILPEPAATFVMVRFVSWLVRFFKGCQDQGEPGNSWKADDTAVWPDQHQMEVAREQNADESLYVFNLNKYRSVARYENNGSLKKQVSGQKAYDLYARAAGFELLRRGAFPVYGGKPLCFLVGGEEGVLADRWDKFIFVRYPRRRDLFYIIESDEFHRGECHRDAGLERSVVLMASGAQIDKSA